MSLLCLSDDLVTEYLNYKFDKNFDKNKIEKLFKYLQPFLVSQNQDKRFEDIALIAQLSADAVFKIVKAMPANELVKKTTLKLQLTSTKNEVDFTQLNIDAFPAYTEKLAMRLSGTYPNNKNKHDAIKHIKALLSDAVFIKITDRYLAADENQWIDSKSVIEAIAPKNKIKLTICTQGFKKHSDLRNICSDWEVKAKKISKNNHDRYIETDKVNILLSSGVFHLSPSSETDFTYVVNVK